MYIDSFSLSCLVRFVLMKLKPYTYTFNFITHILVHLVIVNTLEQSCTLDMSVKIKCIISIIINGGRPKWVLQFSGYQSGCKFFTRTRGKIA